MNNINSYIIVNRKTSSLNTLFVFTSILFVCTFLMISQIKFTKNYKTYGQVIKNSQYNLLLYLKPHQLNIIKNNNKLTINKIEYNYNIESISNEYLISSDNDYYLKVILNIDLKEEDRIINNFLEINIFESEKKLFCYLKDYFMKGKD